MGYTCLHTILCIKLFPEDVVEQADGEHMKPLCKAFFYHVKATPAKSNPLVLLGIARS